MRAKGWTEGREARTITPEDYLPLLLGFMEIFVAILPTAIIIIVSLRSNRILFFLMLGVSIPLCMGTYYLMWHLIRKYLIKETGAPHNKAL
jgi:hypothetical protein